MVSLGKTLLASALLHFVTSQIALVIKNLPASAGDIRDLGSIPGSGRSLGEGNGNPLQYACLEESHGQREPGGLPSMGSQSWTRLKPLNSSSSSSRRDLNSELRHCTIHWAAFVVVVVQSLSHDGLQHDRLPCPSPSLRAYSNLCPLSQ